MELEFTFGGRAPGNERDPDAPFRLLVFGDFSGRAGGALATSQKPLRIDADNFDAVMARLEPRLELTLGGRVTTLAFHSLDDFHPDRLVHAAAIFAEIRRRADTGLAPADAAGGADPADDESDASTLERLLGVAPADSPPAVPARRIAGIDLDAMIRTAIAPQLTPSTNTSAQLRARWLDEALGTALRELLHTPAFQQIEGRWRALRRLACEHGAGEALEVYVLDVAQQALARDIETHRADLRASSLYQLLVTDAHGRFGGQAYAAVLGAYEFGASAADIQLLAGVGAVAAHAGAPFVAAATPALLGGTAFSERETEPQQWPGAGDGGAVLWQALRECPQAHWIGLVMPRIIGRVPYGGRGETIDAFPFTEFAATPAHKDFLWQNGAFAVGQLLTAAFAAAGWDMEPGDVLELEDLPSALYDTDDGPALKPVAEVHLSHASAAHLADQGVMALMSHRERNLLRLARFQSIADPTAALAGPWNCG